MPIDKISGGSSEDQIILSQSSSTHEQEIKQPTTVIKKSQLDTITQQALDDFEEEIKKEKPNYESLILSICRIITFLMRDQVHTNHQYIFENGLDLSIQTDKIHGTFGAYKVSTWYVVSAGLAGVSSIAGLSPLMPASMINPATASILTQTIQPLGHASTGLSNMGNVFGEGQQGQRVLFQMKVEDLKNRRQEAAAERQNKEQVSRRAIEIATKANEALSQAKASAAAA